MWILQNSQNIIFLGLIICSHYCYNGYNYNDKYQKDQKCFLLEIFSTKQPTFIFLYNNDNEYGYPSTLSSVISANDQEWDVINTSKEKLDRNWELMYVHRYVVLYM